MKDTERFLSLFYVFCKNAIQSYGLDGEIGIIRYDETQFFGVWIFFDTREKCLSKHKKTGEEILQ
ncbi:hypothetical protein OMAG_001095 [Candidatus Omnitrophus magneticus]|uniref:Uncharacterized protein n=1 Tax=Candidatus Omnitrophus magneticus TaxID=1609969 RepID=A0A0F0CU02_9BACT|nr:hypothetical protein OMAG_001095 [Candidatus Omnitrophus magneticus]